MTLTLIDVSRDALLNAGDNQFLNSAVRIIGLVEACCAFDVLFTCDNRLVHFGFGATLYMTKDKKATNLAQAVSYTIGKSIAAICFIKATKATSSTIA